MGLITSWVQGVFGAGRIPPSPENSYDKAMVVSEELIDAIRGKSPQSVLVCSIFADLWMQRNNVPVLASIYETHQEMMVPLANGSNLPKRRA